MNIDHNSLRSAPCVLRNRLKASLTMFSLPA